MKEKIFFAILISSFFIPSVFASVSCQNCRVNNCQCTITDCAKGLVDIYSSPTCSGNPLYEYSFSDSTLPWFPDTSGTYYLYAFCDDGHTHSICSGSITVSNLITTTTIPASETETTTSTSETSPSGNSNIVLYVLVIVIIAVVAFIAYRLFSKKGKAKVNYETLYRKWGR